MEHSLEAPHAPALGHVQHELVQAVSGPRAPKERAAHKAVTEAREQCDRLQSDSHRTGEGSAKRGPGRPLTEAVRLDHAAQALDAARREYERLAQQREQAKASIRSIGHCICSRLCWLSHSSRGECPDGQGIGC